MPLVRFLLAHGAAPQCKGNLAVTVAIRKKNLALVRMLIERDGPGAACWSEPRGVKRKRMSGRQEAEASDGGGPSTRNGKRRKLGDRVRVDQAMLKNAVKCDARDIVEYFMKEKGCSPDMQTVLQMR